MLLHCKSVITASHYTHYLTTFAHSKDPTNSAVAGWAAAMLLIYSWRQQLHNKSGTDSSSLLEDHADPLHSSQYSSVSSAQHHHRHPVSEDVPLIADQPDRRSEASSSGSSDRGVLARPFKRRRPPTSMALPLLGQCYRPSAICRVPVESGTLISKRCACSLTHNCSLSSMLNHASALMLLSRFPPHPTLLTLAIPVSRPS